MHPRGFKSEILCIVFSMLCNFSKSLTLNNFNYRLITLMLFPPQMAFGVGKVQMKFLHLLSTEARHSITLHCLNDPPDGFTSPGPGHKGNTTLLFRGWDKQAFEKDTLLEPHVLQDECKVTGRTTSDSLWFLFLFRANGIQVCALKSWNVPSLWLCSWKSGCKETWTEVVSLYSCCKVEGSKSSFI